MTNANNVVHIGENSPEEVAYKLFDHIARIEKVNIHHTDREHYNAVATREWILQTYAACIFTVRNLRPPSK